MPAAAPFPISASCTVELDSATANPLVGLTTDGFGSWSSTFLVPNDPGLAGAQVAMHDRPLWDRGSAST